jgi:TetR/AcrR family transcriptional regulator, cholesterol catabolism regulator
MKQPVGTSRSGDGQQASDRREEILAVATRLFHERGYRDTSLDDIAAAIGFTKAAIYYWFDSKETIFFEIHTRLLRRAHAEIEVIATGDGSPLVRMHRMLRSRLDLILEERQVPQIFYEERGIMSAERERQIRDQQSRYEQLFRAVFDEGVALGVFQPLDPTIAIPALLGACSWHYRWMRLGDRLQEEAVREAIVQMLGRGYLAPAPPRRPRRNRS